MGLFSLIQIYFKFPLNDEEKREIESLAREHGISSKKNDFKINKNNMFFEVDPLVYKKGKEGTRNFIEFLKKLDERVQIKAIAPSVEFKFK